MPDAREIVNKALDGDENPSTYVDWLGKKADVGNVGQIRFGFYIHSTDEEMVKQNAAESGITTDDAFWTAISSDSAWLEENAANIARKFGLYVQGEGHGEDGAYVASAWVSASATPTFAKDTALLPAQIAVVKKILELDGDMPSTTDGTYWKFFPGSETELYKDVSELGRQLLDVTVEFRGTEALAEWLKLNIVESVDDPHADDPESFVRHFVPRLRGTLHVDFNAIKPHFPKVPNYFHRESVDGLILFRYSSASEIRDCLKYMKQNEGSDLFPKTYSYKVPNPSGHVSARQFLEQAGVDAETMKLIEQTNAPIYFYVPYKEFNDYVRLVYPQIKIKEDLDVDNPEGYLDKVTGWIDTFLNAGMIRDPGLSHQNQFWKKYECKDTNFSLYLHVRNPLWLLVLRTSATTGQKQLSVAFTFIEGDTKGLVTQFTALDRLLTKCRTRATGDWPAVDAEIIEMEKQNERDRTLKLSGRRTVESVDDAEVKRYLDAASPEPCFKCSADLTVPFSVVRHYVGDRDELTLEGHYSPEDGTYTNDEPYTSGFLEKLSNYDLPADPDTCKKCGANTAKPDSMRSESVDDVNPQQYVDQIHDLAEITHHIQEYGMFVNRIHVWGRWVVLSGGAYWATLGGYTDEEPLKAEFFRGQLDTFMKKLGITQYHTKVGQTGTNNEHVWYQLGLPKSQLEHESWQPFIRNTSWPEASEDIAKWLPEAQATDPDDPSVNVERHVASMDAGKILEPMGFSVRCPSWNCADKEYKWWEKFDYNTGFKWTVIRKSDDEPHMLDVSISRSRLLPGHPLRDWQQIGGFHCHIGDLEKKLKRAFTMRWGVEGDDTVWGQNVRTLNNEPAPPPIGEAIDPDAPEPNIERFAAHVEKTEQNALESAIANALIQFDNRSNNITDARRADELAVEIANYWAETAGYQNGSDEYDHIVSALSNRAGELFPGDWEDYPDTLRPPVQEGAEHVTNWTEFLDVAVESGHLTRKDAIRYQQRQNPEANEKIYALFVEMDEASQNGEDTLMMAALQQIANLVRSTNMRYGSAIRDITRSVGMDESEVDPEQFIKSQPIEVLTRVESHDRTRSVRFNCAPWFEQATLEDIIALATNSMYHGMQRSYSADNVARFTARLPNYQELADFINEFGSRFETYISDADAKIWVEHNRPDWFAYIWPNDMLESVDDPSDALLSGAFDVPAILKRKGYERHGEQHVWSKVFNRMPTNLDMMIEVKRRGAGGEHNEGDVIYDITLYHHPVSPHAPKEWLPIAHRYQRNNKQIERVLNALEARVVANKLRGIVTDPDAAENPAFDDIPESLDVNDPDDPTTVIAAHTQDLPVAEPGEEVKINAHPQGEAEAELRRLGFEPSWVAGKNTIFGEPEIPNFWSKDYPSTNGSGKRLFVKIIPDKGGTSISVRTRAMSIPISLKPRSMAHVVTIIKDVDAAVQQAATDSLPKEQEIDAILRVLDHHRQWCHS